MMSNAANFAASAKREASSDFAASAKREASSDFAASEANLATNPEVANLAASDSELPAAFQRLPAASSEPPAHHVCTDVIIYVCHNCLPENGRLPRQWRQGNVHVRVVELPCTGKIGTQYMFHALEGGSAGLCVVTCPPGDCTLFEGNYRARMRVSNIKSLLEEIGMSPERVKIFSFSPREPIGELKRRIDAAVNDFVRLPG